MAQTMSEIEVTSSTWTEVADGSASLNVSITSNDILPFMVTVAAAAPAIDAACVRGSQGRPVSLNNLDSDTKVYVRAENSPTKIVVMK